MVSHDGFAKILDFGLAKLVSDHECAARPSQTMSATRVPGPAPSWGPSATCRPSRRAAAYRGQSLGPVLVRPRSSTRCSPDNEPSSGRPRSKRCRPSFARIRRRSSSSIPAVPAPVRWIVDRCLAKNPADRYGSTRDLARDLASARDHYSELTDVGRDRGASCGVDSCTNRARQTAGARRVGDSSPRLGVAAACATGVRPTEDATVRSQPSSPLHESRAPKDVTFTSSYR